MSTRYSLSQRTSTQNSLFAALACAITLTLTAGPALAAPLDRVEVSGRGVVEAPVRYDVTKQCRNIGPQLEEALQTTWAKQRAMGSVRVQLLMENGQVAGVKARGLSAPVARAVRNAVQELDCGPQAVASAQIYRFAVDFVDPNDSRFHDSSRMASAQSGVRVALVSE
ncbi:hypothetical protein [Roseateles asaccharophilus]|uniref:TonB family protein n=1 Tax=Roseateles asaccharophilus TaxID=582607 RepID=A0ABU2ACV6_9BURK|nr:hypothetical protein [Roseateles asaccharophilus]MDR7334820.1 hypothetical protein [Roseateles asaccharophilus]